jgi:hypothetical protein
MYLDNSYASGIESLGSLKLILGEISFFNIAIMTNKIFCTFANNAVK